MTGPRMTAIALLCVLLMIAPPEWGRVKEWFFDKKMWERAFIALGISIVGAAVLAVLFIPIITQWLEYLD